MKNKKKGASKKTWIVDCRTDSAFDFALKVLKEAENNKYPFVLRANFAKIAYSNSCEAIAKAQTNPQEFKLNSAIKLFTRNLTQIFKVCDKLCTEYGRNNLPSESYKRVTIENPFDYVLINYELIEQYFATAKKTKIEINDAILSMFASQYHYPMIFEDIVLSEKPNNEFVKLLPTNDIIVYLPTDTRKIFGNLGKLWEYYTIGNKGKNEEIIKLITGECRDKDYPDPILIHVPYDSFTNVSELITYAANNPAAVDEICMTAYRLGENNSIISDIIKATCNQIHCKLYIELSARGEISRDLKYVKKLLNEANHQYLDIKIHYNGIKVHGKMIYIKLKANPAIGVFSTGNYNADTATVYKDYHYISCEENVTEMIQRNFSTLWNSNQPVMSSISNILSKEIYEEIGKGKNGKIWIQTNHLDNKHIVTLLKEAIRRNCDVKLIVRTTRGFHNGELKNCKTVIGKYLEHSRLYIFGNDENPRMYLSSSDILFRNLYNRFESYVKISDKKIQKQLIDDFKDLYKNGQK